MPNVQDTGSLIDGVQSVVPIARAAGTTAGTGSLRAGADGVQRDSMVVLVPVGAATGTPDSFSVVVKIQDSADNSTYADYAPDGATTASVTVTAAGLGQLSVDLRGARAYVRAHATVAFVNGTSPAVPCAAVLVFGTSNRYPI